MSAAKFPVVEYQTDPECGYEVGKEYGVIAWHGKVAVDLKWVASARPYFPETTMIVMAGSPVAAGITINVAYQDFMRDWMRARE